MRLLGTPGSPFTRKIQVALDEKGLPYEDVFTNIFPVSKELSAVNPMRRVPVLEVDGSHLADSTVIALFLEEQHPEPPLYPAAGVARARALMFEEHADTDLAAAIGLGVFRPLVLGAMFGKPIDTERVRRALDVKLPRIFTAFAEELDGREYFVDERLSMLDISFATHIVNLRHAGQDLDAERWPALRSLVDRTLARPSFVRRIEAERAMLPPPATLD